MFSFYTYSQLIKAKSQTLQLTLLASISPIICFVVQSSHWPTPTLPDGAFDTRPDRAFGSLCGSYVVPVQTGAGDLVFRLRVGPCAIFRACHHQGQWALLCLKLDDVELLLICQRLVGFLQEKEVRKKTRGEEEEGCY